MIKSIIALCISVLLLTSACSSLKPEPVRIPEPMIPADFTTYTEEGLFSISYPSDWATVTSIMDEILKKTIERMKAKNPTMSSEDTGIVFLGGKETLEGYYPSVAILTAMRSTDYWTVDEVFECQSKYFRSHTPGYQELSITKTTVDGLDALVLYYEDNKPDYGKWRHICMYTAKGNFVWIVGCGCKSEDFTSYTDTFNSIVRSLRILQ